jgi:vacuolar-type H+-ATPase subunit I/STV1
MEKTYETKLDKINDHIKNGLSAPGHYREIDMDTWQAINEVLGLIEDTENGLRDKIKDLSSEVDYQVNRFEKQVDCDSIREIVSNYFEEYDMTYAVDNYIREQDIELLERRDVEEIAEDIARNLIKKGINEVDIRDIVNDDTLREWFDERMRLMEDNSFHNAVKELMTRSPFWKNVVAIGKKAIDADIVEKAKRASFKSRLKFLFKGEL